MDEYVVISAENYAKRRRHYVAKRRVGSATAFRTIAECVSEEAALDMRNALDTADKVERAARHIAQQAAE